MNAINNILLTDLYKPYINGLLYDIYNELSIHGFSKSVCNLIHLQQAKVYASLVTKYVNEVGLTEEEAELKFNIKATREAFACNNIDIDIIFNHLKLQYIQTDITPMFNNLITLPNIYSIKLNVISINNKILLNNDNKIITINT